MEFDLLEILLIPRLVLQFLCLAVIFCLHNSECRIFLDSLTRKELEIGRILSLVLSILLILSSLAILSAKFYSEYLLLILIYGILQLSYVESAMRYFNRWYSSKHSIFMLVLTLSIWHFSFSILQQTNILWSNLSLFGDRITPFFCVQILFLSGISNWNLSRTFFLYNSCKTVNLVQLCMEIVLIEVMPFNIVSWCCGWDQYLFFSTNGLLNFILRFVYPLLMLILFSNQHGKSSERLTEREEDAKRHIASENKAVMDPNEIPKRITRRINSLAVVSVLTAIFLIRKQKTVIHDYPFLHQRQYVPKYGLQADGLSIEFVKKGDEPAPQDQFQLENTMLKAEIHYLQQKLKSVHPS
jgi:hypothetical protein